MSRKCNFLFALSFGLFVSCASNAQTIADLANAQRLQNIAGAKSSVSKNTDDPVKLELAKPADVRKVIKPKVFYAKLLATYIESGVRNAIINNQGTTTKVNIGDHLIGKYKVASIDDSSIQLVSLCKKKKCSAKTVNIGGEF